MKWNVTNLCLCFLRWLPPGIYMPQRLTNNAMFYNVDDATCFSHVKHTCKSIEWTCPSVISLLINMEITIKIQSHSSLV